MQAQQCFEKIWQSINKNYLFFFSQYTSRAKVSDCRVLFQTQSNSAILTGFRHYRIRQYGGIGQYRKQHPTLVKYSGSLMQTSQNLDLTYTNSTTDYHFALDAIMSKLCQKKVPSVLYAHAHRSSTHQLQQCQQIPCELNTSLCIPSAASHDVAKHYMCSHHSTEQEQMHQTKGKKQHTDSSTHSETICSLFAEHIKLQVSKQYRNKSTVKRKRLVKNCAFRASQPGDKW